MTPGDKPYIGYRRRRYRNVEQRWENPYGEGEPVTDSDQEQPETDSEQEQPMRYAEQWGPMADEEDSRRF